MPSLHQVIFVQPAIVVAAAAIKAFDAQSLEVETTYTKSSLQQRDGLLRGSYDVAITAMDNTISWSRDTETAFRVIAQIERTTQLEVFGRDGFQRLEDLHGARLAVDAPDSGFVLVLRGALEAGGVLPGSYSLVPCGGVTERLQALLTGSADVALLGPPLTAMAAAAGLHRITTIESVFPDYPGLGLVIRHDRLEELRAALRAYLGALDESVVWMKGHRAELAAALSEAQFAAASINDVIETRPESLRPARAGLRLILDLRRRYDPVFAQGVESGDLVDESLLGA